MLHCIFNQSIRLGRLPISHISLFISSCIVLHPTLLSHSARRAALIAAPAAPISDRITAPDVDSSYTPPLPAIEHVRVPVRLRRGLKGDELGPYFPASGVCDRLFSILKAYAADASQPAPKVPRLVRLAVSGGDTLLHHVVAAYTLLRKKNPELFHGLRVRFFLLPSSKCHLAAYIARHDSWYYRHVYAPFRSSPLVVPWTRDDDAAGAEGKAGDGGGIIAPSNFMRECVTQYVREASLTLPCVVYQLEGFYENREGKEAEADEVIPFSQRCEIGHSAYLEELRTRLKKPANTKPDDLIKDKNYSFQPQDYSSRFTRADLCGRALKEIIEEPATMTSIVISSVPRKGDLVAPANPAVPTLEMYAQGKIDKTKMKRSVLLTEPRQHILDASFSSQVKFRVLVDGQLYGPYSTIKISPCVDSHNVPIYFPVQAFFPIDP